MSIKYTIGIISVIVFSLVVIHGAYAWTGAANDLSNVSSGIYVAPTRLININGPLTGGGSLAGDLTIGCSGCAETSRQILTGSGLQGGGDFSADRTLSINTSTALFWSALHQFQGGGVSSTQLWSASTTLNGIANAFIFADGGGKLTAQVAQTCSGTNKVSSVSATGTVICTADEGGTGGSGTVTTSSAITLNHFPYWLTDGGLSGTSTLTFQTTGLNVTGTIRQSGVAILTTSTGLGVSNFASANISQWTNDNNYITSSTVSGIFPIIWGSATGSISISNSPSFTGTLSADILNATTSMKIPLITTALTSAGQIGISNVTATLNFYASSTQWSLNPEQCDIDFVLEVASSATQTQEDDYLHIFKATSTITRLYSVHKTSGDTATFNIIWAPTSTRSSASSTANHLFKGAGVGGNVTSTSLNVDTYPALVGFASSTVNAGSIIRLITNIVSSTQWGITICHKVNP